MQNQFYISHINGRSSLDTWFLYIRDIRQNDTPPSFGLNNFSEKFWSIEQRDIQSLLTGKKGILPLEWKSLHSMHYLLDKRFAVFCMWFMFHINQIYAYMNWLVYIYQYYLRIKTWQFWMDNTMFRILFISFQHCCLSSPQRIAYWNFFRTLFEWWQNCCKRNYSTDKKVEWKNVFENKKLVSHPPVLMPKNSSYSIYNNYDILYKIN